MTNITAVREALRVRLETIPGLIAHATMPGQITPPAAVVTPAQGTFLTYDQTMDGVDDVLMSITLFVKYNAQDQAQSNLDAYLADTGASSVKAAVDGDIDLDGTAHFAAVTEASNYGIVTFGATGTEYLSCEFAVTIGTI